MVECEQHVFHRRHGLLLQDFVKTRPYLYHLTDRSNLDYIRETSSLLSAATLMNLAGRTDLLRQHRHRHEPITVRNVVIVLRDQAPLYKGNVRLPSGYTFEDFIESLNETVFFWPGSATTPISYGVRHFERYQDERPVILRISLRSLLAANPTAEPLYCRYNSGAPRCSYGQKSPRGPDPFLPAWGFSGTPSQVVEVVFQRKIVLPADVEFGSHPERRWRPVHQLTSSSALKISIARSSPRL